MPFPTPIDCPCIEPVSSKDPAVCPASAYIPLKSRSRTMVVANDATGTKAGDCYVRASCTPQRLTVEVARKNASGDFLKDPLTNKVQSWTQLYGIGPTQPCYSFFNGGPGGTGPNEVKRSFYKNLSSGTPHQIRDCGTSGPGGPASTAVDLRGSSGLSHAVNMGSFTYMARGNRLQISVQAFLRVRGRSRLARIGMSVTGPSVAYNNGSLLEVGATDNHDSTRDRASVIEDIGVVPGGSYNFNFKLMGYEGLAAQSAIIGGCNGYVLLAELSQPLDIRLMDMEMN